MINGRDTFLLEKHLERRVFLGPFIGALIFWGSMVVLLAHNALDFPLELFAEGDWEQCRRESRRLLLQGESDPAVRLLFLMSLCRQGEESGEIAQQLASIGEDTALPKSLTSLACYEAGLLYAVRSNDMRAADLLRQSFLTAPDVSLYRRAGYALDMIIKRTPSRWSADKDLRMQLATASGSWDEGIRRDVHRQMKLPDPTRVSARPGQWIVTFYRQQIAPAIGSRCSLTPSCSEYFLMASRAHGLGGIPMIADRLVREPGEVSHGVVQKDGGRKGIISDPVGAHEQWFNSPVSAYPASDTWVEPVMRKDGQ